MSLTRTATHPGRSHRIALLCLIAALILSACEPRQTATPTPAPTQPPPVTVTLPPPRPTQTPAPTSPSPTPESAKFIGSACPFETPPSLSEGVDLECGYLVVPANRDDPSGANVNSQSAVQLAVAILRHPDGDPEADPIIYLEGGPGGSSLEFLNLIFDRRYAPMFEAGRDIILFDQRGVGISRPALDCPEQDALFFELLDNESGGVELTEEEMDQLSIEAMAVCAANLATKADLANFNTNANAADVKDLAEALGYDQVNLWGASYGTRLALEVMRDYPEIVRSVVLDSSLPPQVNLFEQHPANLVRAFDLLFADCIADEACNSAYPDLEQVFFDTVDALNDEYARFTATDPLSGLSYDVAISGDNFIDLVFQFLYDSDIIPLLPKLIYDTSQGNTDLLALLVGSVIASQSAISDGMHHAVQCAEEVAFNSLEVLEAQAAKFPQYADYFDEGSLKAAFDTCSEMLIAPATDPAVSQPVSSDIPSLVIAGQYDPVTPPAWGELLTQDLENSFYFEYPGLGHAPSLSVDCARQMTIEFLQDPTQAPSDSCLQAMAAPGFVTPPPTEITLIPFENEEMDIRGLAPEGWEEVNSGVYSRQHSSLDAALVLAQAAPLTAGAMLAQISRQIGLNTPPEQTGEQREANGLTWTLYAFSARGVQIDLAIAEQDGTSFIVLLQSLPDEQQSLYEKVFLPMVDALEPL